MNLLVANNGFKKLVFLEARFRKDLTDYLSATLEDAANVWLSTILKSVDDTFPVWTGMAIASLEPLGLRLNHPVEYTPTAIRKDKTPEMGRRMGKDFSIHTYTNTAGGFRFDFYWSTKVPHFIENEDNEAPEIIQKKLIHATPWHAVKTANKAFTDYTNMVLSRDEIPKLIDYIAYEGQTTYLDIPPVPKPQRSLGM